MLLKHFHHLYSYLFVEFDKFWLSEKPKDVMEFNRIRDLFENQMRTLLEDRSAHFKINIAVDNVWKNFQKTVYNFDSWIWYYI